MLVGFGRIVALGLWENLLQAVLQGLLAGPGAIYLFTRSVVLLGAGRAAVFPTLVPPCVLLIGWIALGIVPSLLQLIGLAIVLIGFRLTQRGLGTTANCASPRIAYFLHIIRTPSSVAGSGMEADGLQDTLDALITTLRVTLRTELSSIWLPIQFGAIALAALAAWGCARPRSAGGSIWSRRRWAGRPICASSSAR